MDVHNMIERLTAAFRRRRAAVATIPVIPARPIRASLAGVPVKTRPRPPHRPAPPIRPASNM
ncbi:hypothetical protein [Mesorhizobium sp.]|uniref:hypothetical protein n=1 Tax=Mesorhizobium sp. TaxID=1871066 RepID=UPI0025EE9DF9|nr:hypothetical protein [Mesorhizobium sp.]